jgi:hypothetical protein
MNDQSNSYHAVPAITYIFLIYKRRKTEYTNVLRKLRDKIPLNFIQFTVLPKNESRPKKYRRIVSDTNNSENKHFDDSDFVQNYIKFRFFHSSNFSGKNEKEWKI